MRRNHSLLGILTTAAMCASMLPLSVNAGEKFELNGGGQRKGVSDGYSYELWIDNTGGSGSMTLGEGGAFETQWNCSVPQGNFLARRGMDFAKDNKKATSYGTIEMDYDATYTGSAEGNSRLCVYGWFAEQTAPQISGAVVEYYIIEDWKNWCPKPDGASTTVTINGGQYEVFRIKHYGPTIRSGGSSEEFWQYFSVRKDKRTSGTITVSDHFAAWEKAGFEIYNLYEVALNAEGWESSGSAKVSKLEMTVGGVPKETEAPKPTEAPTEPASGYYMQEDFASGVGSWEARGQGNVSVTASNGVLNVTGRTDNWHGVATALSSSTYIPGNSYSFSVDVNPAASDNAKLTLQYKDASGQENYDTVAEASAAQGKWTQLANTSYTIPAGASDMILYVELDGKTTDFAIDNAAIATKGTKIASGSSDPVEPATNPAQQTALKGDVNEDGKVNIMDIIALQKFLLGAKTTINNDNADMNGDNCIDIFDMGLLKYAVVNGGTQAQQPPAQQPTEQPQQPTQQQSQTPSGDYMKSLEGKFTANVPREMSSRKNGVDYGKMENISYFSTIANKQKKANVLLPAGYDSSKKYPVLYVNHGIMGDCNSMLDDSMGVIPLAGNLAAAGEAEPMIIVFTSMYTSKDSDVCMGINANETSKYDAFREDITECLIPYINEHYSTKTGRENTAISGFSMGGRESLYIGMTKPEYFGYIGAACPAPGIFPTTDAFMTHPGNMQKSEFKVTGSQPFELFIAGGTNDGTVVDYPKQYHDLLTQNGQEHLWLEVQGGGHDGSTVIPMYYNFLRTVFKA